MTDDGPATPTAESPWRLAADTVDDAIYVVDRRSLRIVDANAAACRAHAMSRAALCASSPAELLHRSEDSLAALCDEVIAIALPGRPLRRRALCRLAQGPRIPVDLCCSAQHHDGSWRIVIAARVGSAEVRAGEELQALAESMPQMVWMADPQGELTYINARWTQFTGRPVEAGLGLGWTRSLHPEDMEAAAAAWQRAAGLGGIYEHEFRLRGADGGERWFLARAQPVRDEHGRVAKWFGTSTDIDDKKRAEQALQQHVMQQGLIAALGREALANASLDALLQSAAEAASAGLAVPFSRFMQLTPDGRGLAYKAGVGWSHGEVSRPAVPIPAHARLQAVLRSREGVIQADLETMPQMPSPVLRAHGIRSTIDVPVTGSEGAYGVLGAYAREPQSFGADSLHFLQSLAHTLATAMDRRSADERLSYAAQFDTLTALPNRHLLLDRLAQTLTLAERKGWRAGAIVIDLDRFKVVNDTLGHAAGDLLLMRVAERLQACVRSGDTVARLGADEFVFVLSNLARPDDAGLVAQKVLAALAEPFVLDGHDVYVTASLGIATFPEDAASAEPLLKCADAAMWRAKEHGRNTYQFYLPQMTERAMERLTLEAELRGALERDEFLLHYQPKVDLASGEISGFEALLRWQHPERGLVPPLQFITILEETGLIISVGEWVVRTVCAQMLAWQAAGVPMRPVAVNVSARQFVRRDFDRLIGRILAETGLASDLLELELTESMLMNDPEEAVRMLANLRAMGVRLSVDDFGTGYSSLSYLKRFPIDTLKIDRAFIRDVTVDADDAAIARAVVSLAHSLGLDVVAEGVETQEQLDFLRSHRCDQMQGYFFSRPLTVADCTQALVEGRRLTG